MHREGHLLANHGYDHSLRGFFRSPGLTHHFIVRSGSAIRAITGYFPLFYRPPVGIKTPPRVLSLFQLGLACVGWSRSASDSGAHALTPAKARRLAARCFAYWLVGFPFFGAALGLLCGTVLGVLALLRRIWLTDGIRLQ